MPLHQQTDSDCGYSGKRTAWNKLLQQKQFFWSQTSSELEVWIHLVLLNFYMIVTVSKVQIIALSPNATSSNCSIVALLAILFCYCLRHHLQGIHGQNFPCGISCRGGGCRKGYHVLLLLLAPFQRTSDQGRSLSPVGEQDTATNQRWQRILIHYLWKMPRIGSGRYCCILQISQFRNAVREQTSSQVLFSVSSQGGATKLLLYIFPSLQDSPETFCQSGNLQKETEICSSLQQQGNCCGSLISNQPCPTLSSATRRH